MPSDPQKILFMLIGPKGSGKTHIGTLFERRSRIPFLRIEFLWLGLKSGENGWRTVESAIDDAFALNDKIMVEHLGIGEDFHRYLHSMMRKYTVKMVRIFADPSVCANRVKSRDQTHHIPVSDMRIKEYNDLASRVVFNWSLEIDNNGPASEDEIVSLLLNIT